jgi:hypothetical protein
VGKIVGTSLRYVREHPDAFGGRRPFFTDLAGT